MKILSIHSSNNYQNNTFKAVDSGIMKRAKTEYRYINDLSNNLLLSVKYKVMSKQLTKQDGIDTLKALKNFINPEKTIEKWEKEFKAIAIL